MKKVEFLSDGVKLIGDLYYPKNYKEGEQHPVIICSGSWTTVKEQMAGLYAKKLAERGFLTLAFDFRGFGESDGYPRFYESPPMKIEDIKNAVKFVKSLPEINPEELYLLGICAGSGYTVVAASEMDDIKKIALVAPWLHDGEAVKLFYGGAEGVEKRIAAAKSAKKKFMDEGIVEYIPSISETDPDAAMYGPYDYYLNKNRGAVPQWSADKFALMGWEDWLTFNPTTSAKNLNVPTLMIHSDGAVLPDYVKKYFENIKCQNKKLVWLDTNLQSPFHQFYFYDQEKEVNFSIDEIAKWFGEKY